MLTVAENVDCHIENIPANKILNSILDITPLLSRVVIKETGNSVESAISDLLMGYTQLWNIDNFKGLAVTRIIERPIEKILWVEWMAGNNMGEWVDQWINYQKEIARHYGCTAVEFTGRVGYKRFETRYTGCKPIRTLYRQEI